MLQFRSRYTDLEKVTLPRVLVWILVFSSFSSGYFLKSFELIRVKPLVFGIVFVLILLSFIPIFFLRRMEKRGNFYYALSLSFLDPLFIGLLMGFSDRFHQIFIFLFVLSVIYSSLYLNRIGSAILTIYASLLFLLSVKSVDSSLTLTFRLVVVMMFFLVSFTIMNSKEYFKNIIRHLRIKDQSITTLEFFNIYLVNNLHNGLVTIDENFIVSFWSKAAADILKTDHTNVLGKDLREFFPEICKYCSQSVSDHIEHWESIGEMKICISLKVSPIIVESEFVGNILVFEDITSFKEAQKINERNKHLAGIGRLAATLAHEIRNPLASISGSVEMLKETANVAEEDKALMKIIIREIDGLNLLINELLDYVKPIKLSKKEFNLSGLLKETIELIRYETKVPISEDFDTGIIYDGDQNKLKLVFINILKNAIEALRNTESPEIKITLTKLLDGKVALFFEDNGPGIDDVNLDKIFEPFFTTKESGTGLGLATSRNIVVMHGGDVEVISKPGKTSFKILLS